MKQADKIVLFFPDVVFIFTQAKSRSLLTETGVHCKWLISAQHRWGQLIFCRNQFRVSAKKNRRKKKSSLFPTAGAFSLIYLSAGCTCKRSTAVSGLRAGHISPHKPRSRQKCSQWVRQVRKGAARKEQWNTERKEKEKSHCCHKAKEFRNLGKHPRHFKLERASSWRLR